MALGLFESQAPTLIAESIRSAQSASESYRQQAIDRIERLYRNDDDVTIELKPFESERENPSSGAYLNRRLRVPRPNVLGRIADVLINGVYGDPIELHFEEPEGETSKPNEALTQILAWNNWGRRQREIGYGQIVPGDVWLRVQFVENKFVRSIGLPTVHTCNVFPTYHAANPSYLEQVVERVDDTRPEYIGKNRSLYWVWTRDWYNVIDQDGREVEVLGEPAGKKPNPYDGNIPLVRVPGRALQNCDYGLSYVEDAVSLQATILNWMSEMDEAVQWEIHGILVRIGAAADKKTAALRVGPGAHIDIGPGGDAKFIGAVAAHAELRAHIEMIFQSMGETCGVALSTIRGGGQASSGYQAELEMAPTARVVKSIGLDAATSLAELLRLIVVVGAYHKLDGLAGLTPESVTPEVEIKASILPRDEATERATHQTEVSEGLRTKRDYVKTWVVSKDADDKKVDEYLAELDAEAEKKQAAFAAEFQAKFPTTPKGKEEDTPPDPEETP